MKKTTALLLMILIFSTCKKRDDLALYGNIDGIVTDAVTLQAMQGVVVSLSPTNSSKTTGSDGKYDFRMLNPTEYTIQAVKEGYETNTKMVTVVAGESIKGDIALIPMTPVLFVSVTSLDFGSNLTSLPVSIKNTGKGTLEWSISENADWINVNPMSGSTTTQISNIIISVDRSVLSQGNHNQIISIISNGGNATINVNIIK